MRFALLCLLALPAWANSVLQDSLSTGISSAWSGQNSAEYRAEEGGFVRLYFNKNGHDNGGRLLWHFPSEQQEVTVSFEYRMSPGEEGGSKLLKLFDPNNGKAAYSNATFEQVYQTGTWKGSNFGDNATGANDTANYVRFDGTDNTAPSANIKVASRMPSRQEQETWQSIRIHWKQNDDYRANGEVDIWINGKLRLSADGFRNRGDGHSHLRSMAIGDYTHTLDRGGKSFHMDVRNVSVSFGDAKGGALPMPPTVF